MNNKNNRLAIIKAASKRIDDKNKRKTFMDKVRSKSEKVIKNATEDDRVSKSLEAFNEEFMYDSACSVARIWNDSGVVDAYRDTIRYDNEWD